MDRSGAPLGGAELHFFPHDYFTSFFHLEIEARTDSLGLFSIELPEGRYEVYILPPLGFGYASSSQNVSISVDEPRIRIVIEGFRVSGRVIAPTGAPLDSGLVFASASDPARGDIYASARLRDGRFTLLLPADTYNFSASPLGDRSGFPSRSLRDVSVRSDTTFDIALEGFAVTGTVSANGVPLDSARVSNIGSSFARALTEADGRYTLYLPAGGHRIRVQPGPSDAYILGRISGFLEISGPTSVDFDLSGTEWAGIVRSSSSREPIAEVRVRATLFGDAYGRFAEVRTDTEGRFRLLIEPLREYDLMLSVPASYSPRPPIQGLFASADTTFDILLEPLPSP